MAVLDAIANNITSLANDDLVYVAENLGGGSYQDGKAAISVVKSAIVGPPLTLASGTLTDPSTALTITQTWNDAADTFNALSVNVTNTASSAESNLLSLSTSAASLAWKADGWLDLTNGSNTIKLRVFAQDGWTGLSIRSAEQTTNKQVAYLNAWGFKAIYYYGSGDTSFDSYSSLDTSGVTLNPSCVVRWTSAINLGGGVDTQLVRAAAGVAGVRGATTSDGAALNFVEQTAPSAPSANQVVVYAEDNGSGKTRLMARFNTGAAQVLATEP